MKSLKIHKFADNTLNIYVYDIRKKSLHQGASRFPLTLCDIRNFRNSKENGKLYYCDVYTRTIPRRGVPSRNEVSHYTDLYIADSENQLREHIRRRYGKAGKGNGEGSFIRKLALWEKMSDRDKENAIGSYYWEEYNKK